MTMLFIDPCEIAGKTVKKSAIAMYGTSLIILFTDGSYTSVDILEEDGSAFLYPSDNQNDLPDATKVELGLLTQEEYEATQAAWKAKHLATMREMEIREMKRLMAKYCYNQEETPDD